MGKTANETPLLCDAVDKEAGNKENDRKKMENQRQTGEQRCWHSWRAARLRPLQSFFQSAALAKTAVANSL